VTAGGKHVAGRLRPSPRWSGFSSSCTRSPWGHPPSACCGFRGWVPPRWTSSRRHWPDSLVHRQPARCHGRHLLWTSSCLHDRTLASEPGPSCKRELHHAVLDCRPRGATQRANSRSRSMDSRIDGRLGYHSRESFRRTAAKRTSPLVVRGSSRRTGAKTTGSPVVRGVVRRTAVNALRLGDAHPRWRSSAWTHQCCATPFVSAVRTSKAPCSPEQCG
jgi:hypothetical protein